MTKYGLSLLLICFVCPQKGLQTIQVLLLFLAEYGRIKVNCVRFMILPPRDQRVDHLTKIFFLVAVLPLFPCHVLLQSQLAGRIHLGQLLFLDIKGFAQRVAVPLQKSVLELLEGYEGPPVETGLV